MYVNEQETLNLNQVLLHVIWCLTHTKLSTKLFPHNVSKKLSLYVSLTEQKYIESKLKKA